MSSFQGRLESFFPVTTTGIRWRSSSSNPTHRPRSRNYPTHRTQLLSFWCVVIRRVSCRAVSCTLDAGRSMNVKRVVCGEGVAFTLPLVSQHLFINFRRQSCCMRQVQNPATHSLSFRSTDFSPQVFPLQLLRILLILSLYFYASEERKRV